MYPFQHCTNPMSMTIPMSHVHDVEVYVSCPMMHWQRRSLNISVVLYAAERQDAVGSSGDWKELHRCTSQISNSLIRKIPFHMMKERIPLHWINERCISHSDWVRGMVVCDRALGMTILWMNGSGVCDFHFPGSHRKNRNCTPRRRNDRSKFHCTRMSLDWLLWSGCLVLHLAPGCLAMYMAVLSFAKQANQEIKEDGNHLPRIPPVAPQRRRESMPNAPGMSSQTLMRTMRTLYSIPHGLLSLSTRGGCPPLATVTPEQKCVVLRRRSPYHMGCSIPPPPIRQQSRLQSKIRLYNSEFALKSF
mgnify:CR=1 FL=1